MALSRSAVAERFAALVGEPPMQYLMRWRLTLAARMLRSGSEALSRVAERSGYESQAACNRAFKREFGLPPGDMAPRGGVTACGYLSNQYSPSTEAVFVPVLKSVLPVARVLPRRVAKRPVPPVIVFTLVVDVFLAPSAAICVCEIPSERE